MLQPNVEKIENGDFKTLFGNIPSSQLIEAVSLAIAIDKRSRRKIDNGVYARMLDKTDARTIALAFLLARGTDDDVIKFVHNVMHC